MRPGMSLPLSLLAAAVMLLPAIAAACPNCKDALGDGAATGFYWSTLFLIGAPFVVFGTAGGAIGYVYWRAARRQGGKP